MSCAFSDALRIAVMRAPSSEAADSKSARYTERSTYSSNSFGSRISGSGSFTQADLMCASASSGSAGSSGSGMPSPKTSASWRGSSVWRRTYWVSGET